MNGIRRLGRGVKRRLSFHSPRGENLLSHGSIELGSTQGKNSEDPPAQPNTVKEKRRKEPKVEPKWTKESLDYHCTSSRELTEGEKTGGSWDRNRILADWLEQIGERPIQPRLLKGGKEEKRKKKESKERRKTAAYVGFKNLAELMWKFILPKPQPGGDEPMEY